MAGAAFFGRNCFGDIIFGVGGNAVVISAQSIQSSSSLSCSLSITRPVSSTITTGSSLGAALEVDVYLDSDVHTVSSLQAALVCITVLTASCQSRSAVSGSLSVGKELVPQAVSSVSSVSIPVLWRARNLSGSLISTSNFNDINVDVKLAISLSGEVMDTTSSLLMPGLARSRALRSLIRTDSFLIGFNLEIKTGITLTPRSFSSTSSVEAYLSRFCGLGANTQSVSILNGYLSQAMGISARIESISTLSGHIGRVYSLQGSMESCSRLSANLLQGQVIILSGDRLSFFGSSVFGDTLFGDFKNFGISARTQSTMTADLYATGWSRYVPHNTNVWKPSPVDRVYQ